MVRRARGAIGSRAARAAGATEREKTGHATGCSISHRIASHGAAVRLGLLWVIRHDVYGHDIIITGDAVHA